MLYTSIFNLKPDSLKYKKLIQVSDSLVENNQYGDFNLLLLKEALSIVTASSACKEQAEVFNKLGSIYAIKGELDKENEMYKNALASICLLDTMRLKGDIYYKLSRNKARKLLLKEALVELNKALKIYLAINYARGIGRCYKSISVLMEASEDAKAIIYFDKAKKIFLDNSLEEDYSDLLFTKVYRHYRNGNFLMARQITFDAINSYKKINTKKSFDKLSDVYMMGVYFFIEYKQPDSAFYYLNRGKQIADSLQTFGSHFKFYYDMLGIYYASNNQQKQAVLAFKQAILTFKGEKNEYVRHLYSQIANTFSLLKQNDSAYFYAMLSMKIQDSIHSNDMKRNLIEFEDLMDLVKSDYVNKKKNLESERDKAKLINTNLVLSFVIALLAIGTGLVIVFYRNHNLKIKKANLLSQVDFLKAQLNPHFLFNSINNIYVLIDVDAKKASNVLLKFSELLRYQLYECGVAEISLASEIQFIKNFILFEKLRYDNRINVQLNSDKMGDGVFKIAPLILQPFIENAFKHVSKSKKQDNYITIAIEINSDTLQLLVENNYSANEASNLPGGLGLNNVKKRLELLYNDAHKLLITKTSDKYSVKLDLKLKK